MKRFIPSAFATLAMPFLAMAQSPVPPPDEDKPRPAEAPAPAPKTVVPEAPPAVPADVTPDRAPAAVPPVPGRREKPAIPGQDRPERSGPPGTSRPGLPETERSGPPGTKRRTPPGTKEQTGAPDDRTPAPSRTAPEVNPSADPERTPPPGREMPSARPAETPDTPPTRDTPPSRPGTPGTRPVPGKKSTDPQERGVDPSVTPAPTPGATMPPVTSTPEAPSEPKSAGRPKGGEQPAQPERPEGRGRPGQPEDRAIPGRPGQPEGRERAERPERPAAQKPPTQETAKVLEDEPKRDRQADAAQARKIETPADAKRLLMNILGGGPARVDSNDRPGSNDRPDPRRRRDGSRPSYRPSFEEVGRTQQDRDRTVSSIVERFQGRAPQPAPSGSGYREQRIFETTETQRRTQFYDGNRRVIRYSSRQEIPPIIVASQQLNRVQLLPHAQSTYNVRPPAPQQEYYQNDIPASYTTGDAYAVSYSVDPDSAISTDAILFRQGSTDFADAYSYDLVIDMANAMKSPALSSDTFVIEGHASAEGDYAQNLQLSQERAERISRELVYHGVSAERLMPVGYGEAEASSPADANESSRSLDRRVVVFRMR
ncbi:outer membrane protein OmpA-like peptidoglycan-associated protein [Prosthecobacter fusiformis]|uniref:Outer membrane protein OmpA-like peptidoglycan-associated protein n=1 Tax=Prosthecobacter fusiformis TaxID=48464 RepID=A0A4R7RIX5_9BACT|nr:OmpA family protein [Prosthecobacter fusiformis]TDU63159.1 outer membrane protein OmpA-like peptidoglycan-associated protein [Prosthecobacter fusiformis]